MSFQDESCRSFIEALSSSSPVPGGGAASALAAAIGIALGNMLGNLTVGRKKYADVENDMLRLNQRAATLQKEFLAMMDKDAEAFLPLAAAYKLPTETEEEKAHKDAVMEDALRTAATVPMQTVERCAEAVELLEEYADKGTIIALSDAGVGALLCKAAMQGAALNVYINTSTMQDKAYAAQLNKKADGLLAEYLPRVEAAYQRVRKAYRPEEA